MKVVFDRDYKIRNPGKWDGVWEVMHSVAGVAVLIHQEGRGYFTVAKSILRKVPDAGNGS